MSDWLLLASIDLKDGRHVHRLQADVGYVLINRCTAGQLVASFGLVDVRAQYRNANIIGGKAMQTVHAYEYDNDCAMYTYHAMDEDGVPVTLETTMSPAQVQEAFDIDFAHNEETD